MTRTVLGVLFESSLRVFVLAILVSAVLTLIRARASGVRHAAWTVVLIAMLAMPVLPAVTPSIGVSLPARPLAIDQMTQAAASIALGADVESITLGRRGASPAPETLSGDIVIAGSNGARPAFAWPGVVFGLYVAGVFLLLTRLLVGLARVSRLMRGAVAVGSGVLGSKVRGSTRVVTSPIVSVPLTIGVWRPRIVLPSAWTTWSAETLAAVLAHEQAHIARRDPFVLFLAHFNRCLFWFHPLAWWLERKLSLTAEQACDDAGVRAIGEGRRYAEILVNLAAAVRRRRGRVVWAGVGIDGSGLLGQRIDRIVSGQLFRKMSRTRKVLVALGCAAAIVIAVACRERVTAAEPLKEDPEVTANLQRQKARTEFYNAAVGMTKDQVAELESAVKKNSEDLDARRKLLTFYFWGGQKVVGWNEMVAAKRPHVLWMIEHHPEDDLSSARGLTPKLDPVGYALAKKLWLAQLEKAELGDEARSHGIFFLGVSDKPLAEQMLLKMLAKDPKGPTPRTRDGIYYSGWAEQLGHLYARGILGSDDDTLGNVVKSVNPAEAQNAFAQHARKVLDETRDPAVLYAGGLYLTRNASQAQVAFDHIALGRSYVVRAAQLDPAGPAAKLLVSQQAGDRFVRLREEVRSREIELAGGEIARKAALLRSAGSTRTPAGAFRGGWLDHAEEMTLNSLEAQAVAKLSESDRFAYLPFRAAENYMRAESVDFSHPGAADAKSMWELSKQYARDVLALAPQFKNDPHFGDAVFEANVVLGMNAYREGDVKTAVRHMQAATDVPAISPDSQWNVSIEPRLVNYLLKAGERDSVATFLERAAAIDAGRKDRFLKDAAAIRAGRMPMSYQYMVTPR